MDIDRLCQLVTVPTNPICTGSDGEWLGLESQIGSALPKDYRALVRAYGAGSFANFLWVLNPFTENSHLSLLKQGRAMMEAYTESKSSFPQELDLPVWPELGGLLPCALTDNGDEIYWVTNGLPDSWTMAVYESRSSKPHRFALTLVGLLVAAFEGRSGAETALSSELTANRIFRQITTHSRGVA